MSDITQQEQEILNGEARRRVNLALQKIEAAQNLLSEACSTLSSLCYANPEFQATSKLYDRVKAHWYKVDGSLRHKKARMVHLDSMNASAFLRAQAAGGSTHE